MFIKIDLARSDREMSPPVVFSFKLKDIEDALNTCYLDLGTPYKPIAVDNFVSIGEYVFPAIEEATSISISLETLKENYKGRLSNPQLTCCTVRNVGKKFVDQECNPSTYWTNVFKMTKWTQNTPNGTLYVAPENGVCRISSIDGKYEDYISYSIMFSLIYKPKNGKKRKCYFNVDPLVKISSGGGTGKGNT